ncbi:MAG: hypothetical protein LBV74_20735 [Tannerella sp.]|jgi:glutathione synthase/RimK-type ligase-like ATP-grasp enzyme|nr:hypothetical protein [Tannerella sp.]
MDWLEYYGANYTRVNSEQFFRHVSFINESTSPKDVHWFWKWSPPDFSTNLFSNRNNNNLFKKAIDAEYQKIFRLFFENCQGSMINHPYYVQIDKLSQIKVAKRCGLQTPETIITSKKEEIVSFFKQHKRIINKNLTANEILLFEGECHQMFTTLIAKEDLIQMPAEIFPSLFQKYIDKKYEIRTIYIGGEIFSCAIITEDENSIDVRKSVNENKAYIIPYQLPCEIEEKLKKFMKKAHLQIGSFDMIYNQNDEYVFLELNPSGQFLGYSDRCNYAIEKYIARYLIESCHE